MPAHVWLGKRTRRKLHGPPPYTIAQGADRVSFTRVGQRLLPGYTCACRVAMYQTLPEGSRTPASRSPYGWSVGS